MKEQLQEYLKSFLRPNTVIGLIGVGSFGNDLLNFFSQYSNPIILCDPPLEKISSEEQFDAICELWGNGMGGCNPNTYEEHIYMPLQYLVTHCDLICIQVPLICTGEEKTEKMIDRHFLEHCRENVQIICFSSPNVISPEFWEDKRILFPID